MIVDLIENLAEELAFIETLREQFRNVLSMEAKIKRVRNGASKQRSILDNATSVAKLTSKAVREFRDEFDTIDGQTSEIISVLKNIVSQKEYIRSVRDSLYCRLAAWPPGRLVAWSPGRLGRSAARLGPPVGADRNRYTGPAARYLPVPGAALYGSR